MFEDDDFDDFEELDDFELMAEADDYEADGDAFEEMEGYMEAALMAESEEEEDEFLGALVSTAGRLLPRAVSAGRAALPHLWGAAKRVLNTVRSNPNVRRAARAGVNVIARTAQDAARHYARTGNLNGRYIARRAAGYAARALPSAVYGTRRMPSLAPSRRYPSGVRRYSPRPYPRPHYRPYPIRRCY